MSRPSKKHHFVPQFQLRHFAADDDRRSIWVFDKRRGQTYPSSILNAGSENDFNTVTNPGGKWNFEDLFRDVDGRSAQLVSEIIERKSLAWFSLEDRIALADLFATQLLRTHFSRTSPKHLAERMRENIRELGFDPDADPAMAMPTDPQLRLGAVRSFLRREEHALPLLRLMPTLFAAHEACRFVLSDHPVSVTNAFPYGDTGLASQGIMLVLPIAPDLAVSLVCPTIVSRYEAIDTVEMDVARRARMVRFRDGFRTGELIEIGDEMVGGFNRLQVGQSMRFLYSAVEDFDFAQDVLKQKPDMREVLSHVRLGVMGSGPPPRVHMPSGLNIVVHGPHDHCMLPISEVDDSGEGITARTDRVELLAQVAADPGMLTVELYDGGRTIRGMREAMVELIGDAPDGWFRAVHRDRSLRALMFRLDAELQ
ncbi:MAG: DUF4238 domain-containing protein [Pseudomonadota bacterium]